MGQFQIHEPLNEVKMTSERAMCREWLMLLACGSSQTPGPARSKGWERSNGALSWSSEINGCPGGLAVE
jgi:hypothetical protein